MKLRMDDEFRAICRQIADEYAASGEASLVWSDDLYQSPSFCGGWDPESHRFWFSFYAEDGGDYIFSFTLAEAQIVATGGSIDPPLEYWKQAP